MGYDITYTYHSQSYEKSKAAPKYIRAPAAKVDESNRPAPSAHHSRFDAKPDVDKPWKQHIIQPILEEEAEEDNDDAYVQSWEVSVESAEVTTKRGKLQITLKAK